MAESEGASPGRPSDYSAEIAARICAEIVSGKSLRTICGEDGMPDKATVFRWLAAHEEFCDQYTRAKNEQMTAFQEEMVEIADDKDGEVNRDRLRIDTRKWLMAKLAPKKYGDKVQHVGGDETDAPIRVASVVRRIVYPEGRGPGDTDPGGVPPATGAEGV